MNIIIETPNLKVSRKLIGLVNKKMEKVDQVSDQIIEGRVLLKKEKSDKNKDKVCEIRIAVPGNDLFATDQCATFEEAVANATYAMRRQLVDWKQKLSYAD